MVPWYDPSYGRIAVASQHDWIADHARIGGSLKLWQALQVAKIVAVRGQNQTRIAAANGILVAVQRSPEAEELRILAKGCGEDARRLGLTLTADAVGGRLCVCQQDRAFP